MSLYNKIVNVLIHYSINELGILPCTPAFDDIPPSSQMYHPLLVVDCKLGISLDDLGELLKETQEKITAHREQQSPDAASWELVTRVMVLLKPEHYTAMNARKQLVISGQVSIQEELKLNHLIFTVPRNTKSSIAWYHREWLFTHNKEGMNHLDMEDELELCQRSVTLYPRNYHAWGYRYWLLTRILQNKGNNENDILAKVHLEYQSACRWLETNVSDHTGIRYMEKTLEVWSSTQQQQQSSILKQHMIWLDDLIQRYPGHESLWCHRRYCATLFFRYNTHHLSILHEWLQQQHAFIKQFLNNNQQQQENERNTMQLQSEFAAKFGLWLYFLEIKKTQLDDSTIKNSLVEFYMDQLQHSNDAPIYLHYLKQLWTPSESLHGQDFTSS